jgi:hypothetical protein
MVWIQQTIGTVMAQAALVAAFWLLFECVVKARLTAAIQKEIEKYKLEQAKTLEDYKKELSVRDKAAVVAEVLTKKYLKFSI